MASSFVSQSHSTQREWLRAFCPFTSVEESKIGGEAETLCKKPICIQQCYVESESVSPTTEAEIKMETETEADEEGEVEFEPERAEE